MAVAKNAGADKALALDLSARAATVKVTVAPRKTVHLPGELRHGPGSKIEMDADEADRLAAAGFVILPPSKRRAVKPVVDPAQPASGEGSGASDGTGEAEGEEDEGE